MDLYFCINSNWLLILEQNHFEPFGGVIGRP